MIWSRLKSMGCPKCGQGIGKNWGKKGYECGNVANCDFFIGDEKFNSVIESLYKVGTKVAEMRDDMGSNWERHNF